MPTSDDPTTEQLRVQQAAREHDERRHAATATTPAEDAHGAERRADKAAYLKRKLDEQAASDRDVSAGRCYCGAAGCGSCQL